MLGCNSSCRTYSTALCSRLDELPYSSHSTRPDAREKIKHRALPQGLNSIPYGHRTQQIPRPPLRWGSSQSKAIPTFQLSELLRTTGGSSHSLHPRMEARTTWRNSSAHRPKRPQKQEATKVSTIYFSIFGNKMRPNFISNVYASNHSTNTRSLRFKSRLLVVIALALLAFSILAPLLTSTGNIPEQRIAKTVHFISPATLGYAGIGPTTISLNWTESSDPSFFEYVLQKYSTLLGWETIANLVSRTDTTFFSAGQDANANVTWQVQYQNTGGFQYSNNLTTTQPPAASLSYS